MTSLHPEGRIRIRLEQTESGSAVRLESSRPVQAARWFEGKQVDEALRLLPLLYRVCGTAQAAAATAAVEDARRFQIDADQRNAREALVVAETLREHGLRILTGWNEADRDPLLQAALPGLVRLPEQLAGILFPHHDAFRPGGGLLQPDTDALMRWRDEVAQLLAQVLLGMPAGDWLTMDGLDAIREWAGAGKGAAARFIGELYARSWQACGAASRPPLPALDTRTLNARLDADHGVGFIAEPDWMGQIFETGAFARCGHHPLVQAARRQYGDGLLARSLARLVEVAEIPERIAALLEGRIRAAAPAPADSGGTGQVEAARGRLVHRIRLDGDTLTYYRILAPTEWNFHPRGVVAQALAGLPPSGDLRRLAGLIVEAIDPCVGYDLEVGDNA